MIFGRKIVPETGTVKLQNRKQFLTVFRTTFSSQYFIVLNKCQNHVVKCKLQNGILQKATSFNQNLLCASIILWPNEELWSSLCERFSYLKTVYIRPIFYVSTIWQCFQPYSVRFHVQIVVLFHFLFFVV